MKHDKSEIFTENEFLSWKLQIRCFCIQAQISREIEKKSVTNYGVAIVLNGQNKNDCKRSMSIIKFISETNFLSHRQIFFFSFNDIYSMSSN